jgi:hypothetical protein
MKEEDEVINEIILAADIWAKAIINNDIALSSHEEKLFKAVMNFNNLARGKIIKNKPLPRPPKIPVIPAYKKILDGYKILDRNTLRYSDIPTKPSPPTFELNQLEYEVDQMLQNFKDGYK